VIGEQRAVRAFLQAEAYSRGELEVETRPWPPTTDPRSGRVLPVPPLVILWSAERPTAVLLRSVVAVSNFAMLPRLASLLEAEARTAGFAVQRMPEAGLWRLFSQPPRPRRVGL
jgi:hypothetical protein